MSRRQLPTPLAQAYYLWLGVEPSAELNERILLNLGFSSDEVRQIFEHCAEIRNTLLKQLSHASLSTTPQKDAAP